MTRPRKKDPATFRRGLSRSSPFFMVNAETIISHKDPVGGKVLPHPVHGFDQTLADLIARDRCSPPGHCGSNPSMSLLFC